MRGLRSIVLICIAMLSAAPVRAGEAPAAHGHMLVVTASAGAEKALAPMIEMRKQQGWRLSIVKVRAGITSASLINVIKQRDAATSVPLTHLLLAGSDRALPMARVPNRRIQRVDRSAVLATDEPFGLPDSQGIPRHAIGRLPADDSASLARIARKIVDYEASLASLKPALFLMAGREYADSTPIVAGISPQNMIDGICMAWIDELRAKKYAFALRAHTAFEGRDYFAAGQAVAVFGRELDAAPFMAIYAGHSTRDVFATNHPGDMNPLDRDSIGAITFKNVCGAFFSGGCSMIDPDGAAPSIGEMLAVAPRGPVAFIGYTGINDDFCVMQALEIIAAWLMTPKPKTLGECVREWKLQMMTQPQSPRSRLDQMFMSGSGQLLPAAVSTDYKQSIARNNALLNLIGDPATTFAVPKRATH